MFKNALLFRINDDWVAPSLAAIEEALGMTAFVECGSSERESAGWAPPRGEKHGALVESVAGQLIMKLMVECRVLPKSVVDKEVNKRCEVLMQQRGSTRIGKLEKREIKELVEAELLPMAFTKCGATTMWINPLDKFIVVDAGSMGKADRLITLLIKAMADVGNDITISGVHTATSATAAMASWLMEQEPPVGFSVDRECELRSCDDSKAAVRYANHALDIQEVIDHIKEGKEPTKLAMTFDERVSFVLTSELSLKKVTFSSVSRTDAAEKDDGFDATVAIATGELNRLIPAILLALGGQVEIGKPASEPAAVSECQPVRVAARGAASDAGAASKGALDSEAPWREDVAEVADALA